MSRASSAAGRLEAMETEPAAQPARLSASSDSASQSPSSSSPSTKEGHAAPGGVVSRKASLRLPDIRPCPLPSDEELHLIGRLHELSTSAEDPGLRSRRNRRDSGVSRSATAIRGCGRGASLEDFLGAGVDSAAARKSRGSGGSRANSRGLTRPRPTQRRPIDDETSVPAEVYDRMLQLGAEAHTRATHTLAFGSSTGTPYLRRHDAVARRESPTAAASSAAVSPALSMAAVPTPASNGVPVPTLHSRPVSACSVEAAAVAAAEGCRGSARWGGVPEAVPMQVA